MKPKRKRARAVVPPCDYWVIVVRDGGGFMADVNQVGAYFNTWKFSTYGAAVAKCRKSSLDPRDYVVRLVRFPQPLVLETREIDYGETSLALASSGGPHE